MSDLNNSLQNLHALLIKILPQERKNQIFKALQSISLKPEIQQIFTSMEKSDANLGERLKVLKVKLDSEPESEKLRVASVLAELTKDPHIKL